MVHAPPSKGWKGFVKNVIAGTEQLNYLLPLLLLLLRR